MTRQRDRRTYALVEDTDLFWLIGILEGEGTFVAASPSGKGIPIVRVVMTDRDVVARVGDLLRRSVIPVAKRQEHYKTPYATCVKGTPAVELMLLIEPLMSEARRLQIARAIASWHGKEARWAVPRMVCVITECGRAGARRGLCKRHYNQWWKAKKAGRVTAIAPIPPPSYVEGRRPVDPILVGERALWWLAGLLEGEGTFTVTRADGHTYPVVEVKMCARDIVARAGQMMQAPSIATRVPDEIHWRPVYVARIVGRHAAEWMRRLRPLMGIRRSTAIDTALSAYQPIRLTDPPEDCIVDGCEDQHRSRGLCHKHYMSWMRDVAKGRTPRLTPLR